MASAKAQLVLNQLTENMQSKAGMLAFVCCTFLATYGTDGDADNPVDNVAQQLADQFGTLGEQSYTEQQVNPFLDGLRDKV
jgi:hypothetical protein